MPLNFRATPGEACPVALAPWDLHLNPKSACRGHTGVNNADGSAGLPSRPVQASALMVWGRGSRRAGGRTKANDQSLLH